MDSVQKSLLSTADVARLFNVTETTVKRWADEGTLRCHKTPGGHRKFEIRYLVDFAERNHIEPAGALEIRGEDDLGPQIRVAVLEREFPVLVSAYVRKALAPGGSGLFSFLSYLYQHRVQLWEIHDRVIRPAMCEIGDRWVRGEISICHEHRASYETLEALARLQLQIRIKPPAGRSVLFATLGDELHEIGLRCAAYLFESEGWDSRYLGSRNPSEAVNTAILQWKPQVVCLSATHGEAGEICRELRRVGETASRSGARVLAGGGLAGSLNIPETIVDSTRNSSESLHCYIAGIGRSTLAASPGPAPGQ
jgi:excisionase family DNA binding protein